MPLDPRGATHRGHWGFRAIDDRQESAISEHECEGLGPELVIVSMMTVIVIHPHSHLLENICHYPMEGKIAILEYIVEGLHMTIVYIKVGVC